MAVVGTLGFESIDEFVRTEIDATPLAERIDEGVYRGILEDSREALREFLTEDGTAAVPISGHVVAARKR